MAAPKYDADQKATEIYYAMKGKGCDEGTIIRLLTEADEKQRELLKLAFNKTYGEDLVEILKKELKGKLEDAILGLIVPRRQYLVQEIKRAFKGIGAKEDVLVELILTASNAELVEILELYKNVYGKELSDEIRKELKGGVRDMFLAVLAADRDLGKNDSKIANRAQELKAAQNDSKWSDDAPFLYIFTKSSLEDLKQISEVFQSQTGQDLETIIRAKTKGDFEHVLVSLVRIAKSLPGYYAHRISNAMAGKGCDEKTLLRILLLRADKDMAQIKTEYRRLFGRSLEEAVESELKGDLRSLATALL